VYLRVSAELPGEAPFACRVGPVEVEADRWDLTVTINTSRQERRLLIAGRGDRLFGYADNGCFFDRMTREEGRCLTRAVWLWGVGVEWRTWTHEPGTDDLVSLARGFRARLRQALEGGVGALEG